MPVFRPNKMMLKLAIESLLAQDYQNYEIIIVEDPSDYVANDIIEKYKDERIKYVLNNKRTSLCDQLNKAIALSRGIYIARMDADDICRYDRLSTQAKYLDNNSEISLIGSCLKVIDENNKTLGYRVFPEKHIDIVQGFRTYCTIAHPSVMFRRNDVIELGCYKESAPMEDWDLWCRMALSGKKLFNIQLPLLNYRVHSQAGKVTSLRKTLESGIELKKKYFKKMPGCWGIKERFRCFLERCLMYLPPKVVVALFLFLSMKKKIK